jgi:hypothetical protein
MAEMFDDDDDDKFYNSNIAPDLSASESANNDDDSDDDDHGSTVALMDFEFHWVDTVVSEKMVNKINAVPTAESSMYNPNSLANLCVAKILAMNMANHQAVMQELTDIDVGALYKRFAMFLDPTFASDYGDVTYCWELVGGVHQWLPNCWRELRLLEEYGTILALVACNTPSSMMLARNYFTTVMRRQQHLPTLPTYFGYSFKFENLPNIIQALGGTINKHCNEIAVLLSEQLSFTSAQSVVLHSHMRAFLKRYLPEYFVDDFRESGWLV